MELVKYRDMYVRAGLNVDKEMVKQCYDNYQHFDNLDGAVVMDWGMNIGGFGKMMAGHPIKQYIGVEPHPENFEVAQKNLGEYENFTLINAAVTTAMVDTIDLCLTKSKQNLCSGATNIKSNGARGMRTVVIPVKTVNPLELIIKHQPTHLKCDIEGEEYRIFGDMEWRVPDCIQQLALEFHWQDKVLAYDLYRKKLMDQGFKPIYEELNYIKGKKETTFLGKPLAYRNIWGLDGVYTR
jgi:FkbM family methyltransferase